MLKHLVKVAFRNFWKYKTFSLLNVTGLAIGMAGTLILLLWVAKTDESDQAKPEQSDQVFCWRRFEDYTLSRSGFFS